MNGIRFRILLNTFFMLCTAFAYEAKAQPENERGCTDPQATNYKPGALRTDGSCVYPKTKISLWDKKKLPDELVEISGLQYWEGKLWAINDGGHPPILYGLDTATGAMITKCTLEGAMNRDWEALAQNDTALFIADVGNNASGNRQDLRIYIVPKRLLPSVNKDSLPVEVTGIIDFAYNDQTDFTPQPPNYTRFDCESVVFMNDSLHLFTKNWTGTHASHYVLPATAGKHVAQLRDSIYTGKQMLTDAAVINHNFMAFTSYSRTGHCEMLLMFGFGQNPNHTLLPANQRWLSLPSSLQIGQLEGIAFTHEFSGWLGSENLRVQMANVMQQMCRFDLTNLLLPFYQKQTGN